QILSDLLDQVTNPGSKCIIGELLECSAPCGLSHLLSKRRIAEQPDNSVGHCVRRCRIHQEEACLAIADNLRDCSAVSCHYRQTCGRGLQKYETKALAASAVPHRSTHRQREQRSLGIRPGKR